MPVAPLALASASPRRFWALAAAGLVVTLVGLAAAHYMEEHGHVVTGMPMAFIPSSE